MERKEIQEKILNILSQCTDRNISIHTAIADLDFDSMDFTELACILETECGFKRPLKEWNTFFYHTAKSVDDIITFVFDIKHGSKVTIYPNEEAISWLDKLDDGWFEDKDEFIHNFFKFHSSDPNVSNDFQNFLMRYTHWVISEMSK